MRSLSWRSLSLCLGLLLPFAAQAQARVDVLDSSALRLLDQPGKYSLSTLLGAGSAQRLSDLYKASPGQYAVIANTVSADLQDIIKLSGERMAYSSEIAETMAKDGKVPRHFDQFWLNSARAYFPLIAVVNRVDKKDFYPGTCGEVRFIYRLAYSHVTSAPGASEPVESRSTLPLFLNVVYDYLPDAGGDCRSIAGLWTEAGVVKAPDTETLAANLARGPLDLSRARFKQVELNMQIVRYPSELKFDFGGQAVYLFRIFQDQSGRFAPIPLENTINVGEVMRSKSLRDSLLKQIRENLSAIDQGTYVFDNTEGRLLATRALSFTTVGRARVGNKPFTAVFGADAKDLAGLNYSALEFVKSPRGLAERLNNSTCMGCHQSGGTAGFHMLGRSGSLNNEFNQLSLPFSAHYAAERVRRRTYVQALVEGKKPSTFRPPSFYHASAVGKVRDHCLPEGQKDFAKGLSCGKGSVCRLTAENAGASVSIGECVQVPNATAGNVCRLGVLTSQPARPELGDFWNLFAIRDSINADQKFSATGLGCTIPEQGVPLGRIPKRCQPATPDGRLEWVDKITDATQIPREMCVIQGGDAFDDCAKSSNPPECLARAPIARAFLDTCSSTHFCREDYICQQLPAGISRQYKGREAELVAARVRRLAQLGVGFCVPNYFIFNMRADGHILPEGRQALVR